MTYVKVVSRYVVLKWQKILKGQSSHIDRLFKDICQYFEMEKEVALKRP
jgi:hypothetical protein